MWSTERSDHTTDAHCHVYHSVVIEPVSSNRLRFGLETFGNFSPRLPFSGDGTRAKGQPHENPIKCDTINQYEPTLSG